MFFARGALALLERIRVGGHDVVLRGFDLVFVFVGVAVFRERRAFAQRVLQVDGNAVLPEQVGEGFIRQFLNRCHPVARKLLQLVERVVVEGDQFAQLPSAPGVS